jgi:hypothetical protein
MNLIYSIILIIGSLFGTTVQSLPIYQPNNNNIAIAQPEYKSPSVYIINNDVQPIIVRQPPPPPPSPGPILYEPLELGPILYEPPQQQ